MKVVILAGGLGTRLAEETGLRPKPMVEIGGKPILWHIMKGFSAQGFDEFVICLGYKGYQIKEYFANYFLHGSDLTVDLRDNSFEFHHTASEPWRVTLVDTGDRTLTGGRLKRVAPYLGVEPFLMTYGDGVADVNLRGLVENHCSHPQAVATMTMVQPMGRFGAVVADDSGLIHQFAEKPKGDGGWINGGFFVLNSGVFDYIDGDHVSFEGAPLQRLAADGKLFGYHHEGFWQSMDTIRDKDVLNEWWDSGNAPWRTWG